MNPQQQHNNDQRLAVLAGHARGKTNQQLAREMRVSEETVRSLAHRIKTMLGADTAAHAVALAIKYGLVELHAIRPVPRTTPTPTEAVAA